MPRYNAAFLGQLAQLVEQRIENPRVRGSIPRLATIKIQALSPSQPLGLLLSESFLKLFCESCVLAGASGCVAVRMTAFLPPGKAKS